MLEKFISTLIADMGLEATSLQSQSPGDYSLPLDEGLSVTISEISNGICLRSLIAPYPKTNEETFTTQAMLSNLFGQGAYGAILGLTSDGHSLTLTRIIDYNIDYKEFKNTLEDFINAIDLWREEAINHK